MKERISQLDGMRFIMCCMIVAGHCTFIEYSLLGWICNITNAALPLDLAGLDTRTFF